MKKFRAFLVALALAFTAIGFTVAQDVTPVSAQLTNCARGGQYYSGGTYAGIACFTPAYGGGQVGLTITCRYYKFWSWHTYNRTSLAAGLGSWSWVSCDNTGSGDQTSRIIHAQPFFTGGYANGQSCGSCGPSYWGYPFVF